MVVVYYCQIGYVCVSELRRGLGSKYIECETK